MMGHIMPGTNIFGLLERLQVEEHGEAGFNTSLSTIDTFSQSSYIGK